jgi:membrane-associated phospholipid phosphatase
MRGDTTRPKAAMAATALGIASWSIGVAHKGVPAWDRELLVRINHLPDALALVVWGPMQAGALAAPLGTAGVLVIRGDRRRAVRVAVTGVSAWMAAKAVKRLVGRGRPSEFVEDTRIRMGSADHGLGFPSGHAAVAVTLVTSVLGGRSTEHRGGRLAGAGLAGLVGISRIYVGAHFPLDVIGGWAIGSVLNGAYDGIERLITHRKRRFVA